MDYNNHSELCLLGPKPADLKSRENAIRMVGCCFLATNQKENTG